MVGNVVGGYKATMHNPNVSEEAKEHAEHVLEDLGAEVPPLVLSDDKVAVRRPGATLAGVSSLIAPVP